jgi:hypothetical protein
MAVISGNKQRFLQDPAGSGCRKHRPGERIATMKTKNNGVYEKKNEKILDFTRSALGICIMKLKKKCEFHISARKVLY